MSSSGSYGVRYNHFLSNQSGLKTASVGVSQTWLFGFILSSEEVVDQETKSYRYVCDVSNREAELLISWVLIGIGH